jgi:hypothetical protein
VKSNFSKLRFILAISVIFVLSPILSYYGTKVGFFGALYTFEALAERTNATRSPIFLIIVFACASGLWMFIIKFLYTSLKKFVEKLGSGLNIAWCSKYFLGNFVFGFLGGFLWYVAELISIIFRN